MLHYIYSNLRKMCVSCQKNEMVCRGVDISDSHTSMHRFGWILQTTRMCVHSSIDRV
jgi:hypothetical protein